MSFHGGYGGEQAQSYFLERQNSHHQHRHSLGQRNNRNDNPKHGVVNKTPLASNVIRKSSSNVTFVSTISTGSNLREDEENTSSIPTTTSDEQDGESMPLLFSSSPPTDQLLVYGSSNRISPSATSSTSQPTQQRTIRFQVVVWNIGKLDVVSGSIPMTFRVSLFWNDILPMDEDCDVVGGTTDADDDTTSLASNSNSTFMRSNNSTVWKMHGRNKAIMHDFGNNNSNQLVPPANNSRGNSTTNSVLDVPPLSILNVATFETIGGAEIDCLDTHERLFRWTAMYRATVLQSDVDVEHFPHDLHNVQLKLAILSHRSKNRTWDATVWKLALATEADSQYSTRIPYGMIVDQVKIPGFAFNRHRGLQFEFCPLQHGSTNASFRPSTIKKETKTSKIDSGTDSVVEALSDNQNIHHPDYFLRVSVTVLRESGYYDQNIVPLVALLNVVAVSVLTFQDSDFFYRALITLNIAFVEMSIRMTADSHLPSVGYQIRLQRILNEWFVILMMLVLEGMVVFVMRTYLDIDESYTKALDWITAISALGHNISTVLAYYRSKKSARYQLDHGFNTEKERK
ncbi:hypothetical protein IV203_023689 [Nitzschia inconspicua]|uniref:Uncharacterized protein n=1 Tax=Nitzschia inconspicua TaxID=303405 RepID=A0A9K3KE55_9STRA|nr:hypothetical protein IV203_023689 [Nitzschia inconspicua]